MAIRFLRQLLPLLIVATAGVVLALGASAASTAPAKTVPICKKGQKSTKAHPCKAAPKKATPTAAKPSTGSSSSSSSSSSSGSTGASAGAGAGANPDGCAAGTQIPPGGDDDADNGGGPSDGDGCI